MCQEIYVCKHPSYKLLQMAIERIFTCTSTDLPKLCNCEHCMQPQGHGHINLSGLFISSIKTCRPGSDGQGPWLCWKIFSNSSFCCTGLPCRHRLAHVLYYFQVLASTCQLNVLNTLTRVLKTHVMCEW